MKNHIFSTLCLAALAFLGSCSDDTDGLLPEPSDADAPAQLTLTLALPDFQITEVGSRAAGRDNISSLSLLCYDSNGVLLETNTALAINDPKADGHYEVTVPLHARTHSVQFVANATVPAGTADLSGLFVSDASTTVLWAKSKLADLLDNGGKRPALAMLRNMAKVSVSTTTPALKIEKFGVYGTAAQGSVAPADASANPRQPTVKDGDPMNFNLTDNNYEARMVTSTGEAYFYETPADELISQADGTFKTNGRVIVKATYNGTIGYYPLAFRNRVKTGTGNADQPGVYSYEPLAKLRNHHYRFTISEVRAAGYPTVAEAVAAEPDNRITVLITDTNEDVNTLISTRDYELGVADEVVVNAAATSAVLTVVTGYTGTPALTLSEVPACDWVETEKVVLPSPTVISRAASATAKKYTITVPVKANNLAEDRECRIKVQSGELSLFVTLRQEAFNYLTADNRRVTMIMDNSTITSDYFSWVTSTLKGASQGSFADANLRRDNGLNFPAIPSYTVKFQIPALSGDKNPRVSGAPFVYAKNGSNYEITMSAQSVPGVVDGTFKVENSEGITITYPLYRRGYIHELKSGSLSHQPAGIGLCGWFYYEAVKTTSGSKWTFDRNVGASCGRPYITTIREFKENNHDAVGAYFRIGTSKSATIWSSIGMTSRLVIPTEDELTAMNVHTEVVSSGRNSASMAVITCSGSSLAKIYVPHGGYYEGSEMRYETYAQLWSSTLVSGNQGFSPQSPDYGWWYRYLFVSGTKTTWSNTSVANGDLTELSSDSDWIYMPIRPVWR